MAQVGVRERRDSFNISDFLRKRPSLKPSGASVRARLETIVAPERVEGDCEFGQQPSLQQPPRRASADTGYRASFSGRRLSFARERAPSVDGDHPLEEEVDAVLETARHLAAGRRLSNLCTRDRRLLRETRVVGGVCFSSRERERERERERACFF